MPLHLWRLSSFRVAFPSREIGSAQRPPGLVPSCGFPLVPVRHGPSHAHDRILFGRSEASGETRARGHGRPAATLAMSTTTTLFFFPRAELAPDGTRSGRRGGGRSEENCRVE